VAKDHKGGGEEAREGKHKSEPQVEVAVCGLKTSEAQGPACDDETLGGERLIYGIVASSSEHKQP
jgi:hypothetical protein